VTEQRGMAALDETLSATRDGARRGEDCDRMDHFRNLTLKSSMLIVRNF